MNKLTFVLKFFFLFPFLLACGTNQGGSEFGNASRQVQGNVVSSSQALLAKQISSESCPADQVIATNSSAVTTVAALDENCSFTLTLAINKSYSIGFVLNGQFVASMVFTNSTKSLPSNTFVLSQGSSAIQLGTIIISGTIAIPSNQPSSQNDQDGDGIPDYDDDDDDGDGIGDDDEEDCDLDGYFDDYDDDDSECEDEDNGGSGTILEVNPRNGKKGVDLDEQVQARFNCVLDPTTVNASTFQIKDPVNHNISCTFDIEGDGKRIECEHGENEEDFFSNDTTYTATLDGIKCQDGTTINTLSWSWSTKKEDD